MSAKVTMASMIRSLEHAGRVNQRLQAEADQLRGALRAIIAEITDEAHEDSEDADEMIESLMKIHELAKAGLRTTSDPHGSKR